MIRIHERERGKKVDEIERKKENFTRRSLVRTCCCSKADEKAEVLKATLPSVWLLKGHGQAGQ